MQCDSRGETKRRFAVSAKSGSDAILFWEPKTRRRSTTRKMLRSLKTRKQMNRILIALAVAGSAAAQTPGTESSAVVATVHQFVDGFNKGDTKMSLAACALQTSIVDDFPPHEWHGAGACAKWMDDFDADARKNAITDGIVVLSSPTHVDVTADRAYFVAPATYTYKKSGKPVREAGSTITVALQKSREGWRITGWAWAKH